ncbi:hypothetical protein FB563_7047 [Streptomyces puniciscabiei]|uniref:Uncharacterized protein n=1 Tax=Streptomyces puniciscabiei TaxID=164348 RepID=A0A542TJ75_9ACTN|nr:hypothetical protein FB563_7047 [Streptomyces puniciscabiei]
MSSGQLRDRCQGAGAPPEHPGGEAPRAILVGALPKLCQGVDGLGHVPAGERVEREVVPVRDDQQRTLVRYLGAVGGPHRLVEDEHLAGREYRLRVAGVVVDRLAEQVGTRRGREGVPLVASGCRWLNCPPASIGHRFLGDQTQVHAAHGVRGSAVVCAGWQVAHTRFLGVCGHGGVPDAHRWVGPSRGSQVEQHTLTRSRSPAPSHRGADGEGPPGREDRSTTESAAAYLAVRRPHHRNRYPRGPDT